MVYQTLLAEPSPSLQQSRSSDKIVDALEPMLSTYDSEESQSSYEEEVHLGKTLLIASSSSYGSESTQEEDEVEGANSDNFLDDPIDSEEGVSENSQDSDEREEWEEWEEFDEVDSKPSLDEEDKEAASEAFAVTVIHLQHVIDRTDDVEAQHQEVEKESPGTDECRKKTRSFCKFRRHKSEPSTSIQGKKSRVSPRRSLVSAISMKELDVDSREDTEENTDTVLRTLKSPPKDESHCGSQHVLASEIALKASREQEDEESTSSNDYDSREDTEAFTEDPDFVASVDSSRCQTNGEWSKLANPAVSLSGSELSEESADDQESIKSNKSARTHRSLRAFRMFKRRRRDDIKSIKIKGDEEKDEETTKTAKTYRSWFRRRKRKKIATDEKNLKFKRLFSLFRKPSWGRRNHISTLDEPQEPLTPEQPSFWETFFEGCDKICCASLNHHSDAEENASIHSDQSKAPSEIFVHLDSSQSKSLYTI